MANSEMVATLATADRIHTAAMKSKGAAQVHGLDAAESLYRLAGAQAPDLDCMNRCEMKAERAGRQSAAASVVFFADIRADRSAA